MGLRAAYDRNLAATGRTLVGREADADGIPDLIRKFLSLADGATLDDIGWDEWGILGAAQDLRAYYEEAAVQLADITGARQSDTWFYSKTATGQLMHDLTQTLTAADAPDLITGYLVPMAHRR
jgi:hypothetical protein